MLVCIHRGRCRGDLPHRGPCCVPYECSHPATPRIVTTSMCRPRYCRYHTLRAHRHEQPDPGTTPLPAPPLLPLNETAHPRRGA